MPLVTTIRERCRVCYTCVRECPAKAIRIVEGQAEVIGARCIGCGNCVRVCSQHAKQVLSSVDRVFRLLESENKVAACLAPSFPAEFDGTDYRRVVGMLHSLGFDYVYEVGFGADLVAAAYRRLLEDNHGRRFIATSCPAIVAYVERYHPGMVGCLAPVVSPMVATARFLRSLHGPELKTVFIGPCIAKKGEAASVNIPGELDEVLTFSELREMFAARGICAETAEFQEFDPPRAGEGALFPISRGLLQAAEIEENLITGEVVAADGRSDFVEAIREFEQGHMDARLLEVLCCNGCIMGSGMTSRLPLFSRRSSVGRYVRQRLAGSDPETLDGVTRIIATLDLARSFTAQDQRMPEPGPGELEKIMARMGKFKPGDELNCGACGYETCREHSVAIYKGLAESEMCLPYTIEQLRITIKELAVSNETLASVRESLKQSEKLATMGQLAAGIAHEVNNPLGVVLMYSHLLLEECNRDEHLRGDLRMIVEQADRCKKIVAGLLNFARRSKVVLKPVEVPELIEASLRSVSMPENVSLTVDVLGLGSPTAEIDSDQMVQAVTNLITNAVAAMPDGGRLVIRCEGDEKQVRIQVIDTGVGIPEENLGKIFEPFFSTKKLGVGTGLGLAVTYGIVKMHRGDITLTSNTDPGKGPTGTTFTVALPRKASQL
ncbi:MAG: histidine kinase [Candidatus Glassbacteria bacterium]|nr:histidine kinase [Candidatus Glassbacteria bacterium]